MPYQYEVIAIYYMKITQLRFNIHKDAMESLWAKQIVLALSSYIQEQSNPN